MNSQAYLQDFLTKQHLPAFYLTIIEQWFRPLAQSIASAAKNQPHKTLVIAINGCQGSGKSTLAALLETLLQHEFQLSTLAMSLDDFYKTRQERQIMAAEIHPLFQTRGVPGTHDTALLHKTLSHLTANKTNTAIPSFNKATDDRRPKSEWRIQTNHLDIVILEGWCLGAVPQIAAELKTPINQLESTEDPDGTWREHVNNELHKHYLPIYEQFDLWVMLKAPSFDSVMNWRLEQEQKLATELRNKEHIPTSQQSTPNPNTNTNTNTNPNTKIMSEPEIRRFIQHYQRLTENCLKYLPKQVHHLYELNDARTPIMISHPQALPPTDDHLIKQDC
jgi:D-glycerate 3-kinase